MHAAPPTYTLSDFDFDLPPELVAQHPAAERSASRLLDATVTPPADRRFRDLPSLLRAGDLLVVNDTRVIRARLFGTKASGGAVEALVERVLPGHEVLAHLRASKSPRPGTWLRLADAFDAQVLGRGIGDGGPADAASDSLFRLRFPDDPFSLLERHGHVPLPPYITHADAAEDAERYQTVFAQRPGAVAAPTAALHFDAGLIAALREHGVQMASVTLHVGAGTFQPVRTENIAEHTMHREWFEVTPATVDAIERTRAAGGRVVAVGTTSLRALESAAAGFVGAGSGAAGSAAPSGSATQPGSAVGTDRETETVRELTAGTGAAGEPNRSTASPRLRAGSGETGIFITPGFEFRVVDLLVTNFHLPRSTLMMLVSAFSGHAQVMALYRHAVDQRYRFFSYGDAMLLQRSA